MSDLDFKPMNDLEIALVNAIQGKISFRDFMKVMMRKDVCVLSGTEIQADGQDFCPLLFHKPECTLIAVFTACERATQFGEKAPFCLNMKGHQLISRVPVDLGLVLNPGFSVGFELPANGVKEVRQDLITPENN